MTTDKKQPPDTDREVLVRMSRNVNEVDGDFMLVARYHGEPHGWSIPGIGLRTANIVDWRELPSWDRLAILDRYDEERAEWERQVKEARAGTDGLRSSGYVLETRVGELKCERDALRSQVTALTEERDAATGAAFEAFAHQLIALAHKQRDDAISRADRAEKERDEAMARLADTGRALNPFEEIEVRRRNMELDGVFAERDRAIAERDELRASVDWHVREIERVIRERDDLGCQLEALRSVQRGDVADLRTRMEAVERWRDTSEMPKPCSWCLLSATTKKNGRHWCGICRRTRLRVDEKGGA